LNINSNKKEDEEPRFPVATLHDFQVFYPPPQ